MIFGMFLVSRTEFRHRYTVQLSRGLDNQKPPHILLNRGKQTFLLLDRRIV